MFGNIVLNDETDDICRLSDGSDAFGAERWGWQAGPLSEGSYTYDVWAAAGQNDTSKGTLVGYVDILVSSGNVTVIVPVSPASSVSTTSPFSWCPSVAAVSALSSWSS